jgi:hypothetical protein
VAAFTASRTNGLVGRGLIAVAGVLCLLAVLSFGSTASAHRWDSRCLSGGGYIRVVAAEDDNPLIVQSSDPTYQCLDPAGVVISRR